MIELTILTPTYNRGHKLLKCYESLQQQTNSKFQWLVIDDGSEDTTEKIMRMAIKEKNKFVIDYYKKENGGKHTALNYAHPYIQGNYVLILDSDDYLVPDAVNYVLLHIEKYNDDKSIGVFSFRRMKENGSIIGSPEAKDEFRDNHILYRVNSNMQGDQCEVIRSELLKKYKFPVCANEKFLGEDYLWIHVANKYDTIYFNKAIYVCEYLPNGLTNSGRRMRIENPVGGMIHGMLYLSEKFKWKYRLKGILLTIVYALFAKRNIYNVWRNIRYKSLFLGALPIAIMLYFFWRVKYRL